MQGALTRPRRQTRLNVTTSLNETSSRTTAGGFSASGASSSWCSRVWRAGVGSERVEAAVVDRGGAPCVWVVRAGAQAESFELGVEQGFCGIGWPQMGDLSGLDEQGIADAVEGAFPDDPVGRRGNFRGQLRDFMAISAGDLVLMPDATRRIVAVGEVAGPYRHWPDGPDTANHVIPVQWLATDIPQDLVGDLGRWVSRPVTVSRVPPDDAEALVRKMLDDRLPIRLTLPAPAGPLRDLLESVLESMTEGDRDRVRQLVTTDGPEFLSEVIGDEHETSGGAGIGTDAEVPWITVYPQGERASSQAGYYAVYLFSADGSAVYLSLNQGTDRLKGGIPPLRKRALDLRSAAGLAEDDPGAEVDLRSDVLRPRRYAAGSAYAFRYASW